MRYLRRGTCEGEAVGVETFSFLAELQALFQTWCVPNLPNGKGCGACMRARRVGVAAMAVDRPAAHPAAHPAANSGEPVRL